MNVMPLQGDLALPSIGLGILLITIVVGSQSLEIVQPYENRIVTVFGQYRRVLDPGINVVLPFVSQTYSFNILTQTLNIPRQTVSTRDDVPVMTDAEVFFTVTDAKKAFLEVDDYKQSVTNLAQTTVREVLGNMEFGDVAFDDMTPDERQTRREEIRTRIENEYEQREGISLNRHSKPKDMTVEEWVPIDREIRTRTHEEFVAIDDGLKQRMEITYDINARVTEDLNKTTDGWGVEVMSVGVTNLTPNPDPQTEMNHHRASSHGTEPRRTE